MKRLHLAIYKGHWAWYNKDTKTDGAGRCEGENMKAIKSINYCTNGWMGFSDEELKLKVDGCGGVTVERFWDAKKRNAKDKTPLGNFYSKEVCQLLQEMRFESWAEGYGEDTDLTGDSWWITVRYTDGTIQQSRGDSAYPTHWKTFKKLFQKVKKAMKRVKAVA